MRKREGERGSEKEGVREGEDERERRRGGGPGKERVTKGE